METVMGILGLILIIWFIFGMIKPRKAAPFLGEKKTRLKIFGIFIIVAAILGNLSPHSSSSSSSSVKSSTAATEQSKEPKMSKSEASQKIMTILNTMPYKKHDEVENVTWYKTYPNTIPPETRIYWDVGIDKNKNVSEHIYIVYFSDDMPWVFFDKLKFHAGDENWEYTIGSIAGQSGNGKSVEVVMGGKYETFNAPYSKLEKGIDVILSSANPILRLQGDERYYDLKVSPQDIEQLKQAKEVHELLKITNNKVE